MNPFWPSWYQREEEEPQRLNPRETLLVRKCSNGWLFESNGRMSVAESPYQGAALLYDWMDFASKIPKQLSAAKTPTAQHDPRDICLASHEVLSASVEAIRWTRRSRPDYAKRLEEACDNLRQQVAIYEGAKP